VFKTHREVFEFINAQGIVAIDLKTTDLFGRWRHLTTPARYVDETVLREGFGFDGSSYGFKKVNDSDMIMIPDISTGFVDPFWTQPTLSFICDIHTTADGEPKFEQDPRSILAKAEQALYGMNIGNKMLLGPEYEFYVFDGVQFGEQMQSGAFGIDSIQAPWNCNTTEGNGGYAMPLKGGYHGNQPEDRHASFRGELVELLHKMSVGVKYHHHEVGGLGQMEIETDFDTPLQMADKTMLIKYATKNYAKDNGLTATFMPKPMYGAPGNGFHVHFKLLKDETNVFADERGYAGMSQTALQFMTGILVHAKALSALANPSTNSYKRLVPGYEAPVSLVFAQSNRSAAIRIPGYVKTAIDKRFEYRAGDATANPYLMFASMIMAGIDGVRRKLDPTKEGVGPFDGNLYELSEKEQAKIKSLPHSLDEALHELRKDYEFLLADGVFSQSLIDTWIKRKHEEEFKPIALRPHPYEFNLSYNC
jgi:glutamine synthetase